MREARHDKITTPFKEVKELAQKMSLILHSTSMHNVRQDLIWECEDGHKFEKSYYQVERVLKAQKDNKEVCDSCSLLEIKRIGREHKHKLTLCTGQSFKGWTFKYEWECKEGHINKFQRPKHADKGGCPDCIDAQKFNSIEKINNWLTENATDMRISKGEQYKGSGEYIKLYCKNCKRTSERLPHQIKEHSLCKYCSNNKYELIVLQYMEQLFGEKWSYNEYPFDWLKNRNGEKMQLDGYCEKLKLAFEHHGRQHYKVAHRTTNEQELEESQARDRLKEELCLKHDIKLIVIKQLITITPLAKLKEEIKNQCEGIETEFFGGFNDQTVKKKYPLPEGFDKKDVKIENLSSKRFKDQWPKILDLAEKLNFEVLKDKPRGKKVWLKCQNCTKETERTLNVFLKKKEGCKCQGAQWGIDLSNKEKMQEWYTKVAKKYNAEFLGIKRLDSAAHDSLEFRCKTCDQNPNLIQPLHSVFFIKDYDFRGKFEKPLGKMQLKVKNFHPDCGAFKLPNLTLKDLQEFIKKIEPTAEIITTENEFISKGDMEYQFRCSNKRHEPHTWSKKLKNLRKTIKENQSIGCRKCGQLDRKRTS